MPDIYKFPLGETFQGELYCDIGLKHIQLHKIADL